jgi:phospholipid/cholesterol/gamma-HCH transport system ATP-binding protein
VPLVFRGVSKSFGPKRVLEGVDLAVEDGECFFIVGTSGVGKSVLIKQLVGLLRPEEGTVWVDGIEVSKLVEQDLFPVRKKCAMVFQHSTLFDSMTCAENVALPLRKHRRMTSSQALTEARRRLGDAQLGDFADRYPVELGDGMKKQVAIVRALALDPAHVLLDEPTTSLDPVSARRVDRRIRQLCDERGVTALVVSHDLKSMFAIADRIALLYQGRIRLLGTPEAFRHSEDAVVRQFVRGDAKGPMEV